MIIKKYNLDKGDKSIIVSEVEGMADSLIIHSAQVLSNDVEHISNLHITPDDKLIYICGHTNLKKRTIGKYNMQDLARVLCKSGYDGTQDIYITACDSNTELDNNISLKNELRLMLYNRLNSLTVSIIPEGYISCKVESQSEGSAVVKEDSSLTVIKATNILDQFVLSLRLFGQYNIQSIKLNIEDYDASHHKKATEYKNRILKNHIAYSEIYLTLRGLSLLVALAIGGIAFGVFSNYGLLKSPASNIVLFISLVLAVTLNIAEDITMRKFSEDGNDTTKNILTLAFVILTVKNLFYFAALIIALQNIL